MNLKDFFIDPEAEAELNSRPRKKKVTIAEHQQYVLEALTRAYSDSALTRVMDVEKKYQQSSGAIRNLTFEYDGDDISTFVAHESKSPRSATDIGIFVSALINSMRNPQKYISLDLRGGPPLDYLGYKLNRGGQVFVLGDLGNHTASMMESESLVINGNCNGIVGHLMKDGKVVVYGTIGHVGIIRYGGQITHKGETARPRYVSEQGLIELLRSHRHDHRLANLYNQLISNEPAYLDPQLKEMLHPVLLETVFQHDHQIFFQRETDIGRQIQSLLARGEHAQKEYSRDRIFGHGEFVLKVLIAGAFTVAVPPLVFLTIPYAFYEAFRNRDHWKKSYVKEETTAGCFLSESEELENRMKQNVEAAIENLEFYLSLPGVKDAEAREQLSKLRSARKSFS